MNQHAVPLDAETKAVEGPEHHADELRLWLRLLTCTTLIEGEVRRRLRDHFDVTLPRFDLMAQLDRTPQGMTLSALSKRMMVSNGNLTGLVDRLVESGHCRYDLKNHGFHRAIRTGWRIHPQKRVRFTQLWRTPSGH